MELIKLESVEFGYEKEYPLLKQLDFSLKEGGRIGILGANGVGKTTLFLVIMGLLSPNSGVIRLLGKKRSREKDFSSVRTQIGYCFQDPDDQLFSATVKEDIAFGPLNQGKSFIEVMSLLKEISKDLNLQKIMNRSIHHLSGGEKRLVSLATVLVMKPRVLLLDEPTIGLDSKAKKRFEEILLSSKFSWAIISHDINFLKKTCRSILSLEEGVLKRNF